jgi:phage-related minor tail protein
VQRGKPTIVGERGAELFVPASSGSIVPNNQMGGEGVTVNQTINVSTGVSQTVRAEMVQLMPQIVNAAKSGVLDAKKRGGSYGAAF